MAEGKLNGFHLKSIVKETGIDDDGLKEFITEYFPYICYKDQERVFYKNLGSGTMFLGFNPMNIVKLIMNSKQMMHDLNVSSWNTKGEETSKYISKYALFLLLQCLDHHLVDIQVKAYCKEAGFYLIQMAYQWLRFMRTQRNESLSIRLLKRQRRWVFKRSNIEYEYWQMTELISSNESISSRIDLPDLLESSTL